jgi:hypothetical protein
MGNQLYAVIPLLLNIRLIEDWVGYLSLLPELANERSLPVLIVQPL